MPAIAERPLARRKVLVGTAALGAAALGVLALPGLASAAGADEPIRKLLELASRNTLLRLGKPDGFWTSRVGRIGIPVLFKRGASPGGPLRTTQFLEQLQHRLNTFAEPGAQGAVPAMEQAARSLIVLDPDAVLRGAPTAATSLLRLKTGSDLINAMIPPIEAALVAAQDPVIGMAVSQLPGVTLHDVAHAVALAADNGIWYEIGATEADIRMHPEATGDPALTALLKSVQPQNLQR
jgi:hypothetical protein